MTSQKTLILALLTLLTAGGAALSYARMDRAKDDALASERDLNAVRRDLADIAAAAGNGAATTASKLDTSEADRRVRQAAAVAGLSEKLQARLTDTLDPRRLGNSEYSEKPVILRFEGVTLQQVLTFLHTLSTNDPGCRSVGIELSPSEGTTSGTAETWTADLTVAYLLFTPKESAKSQQQQSQRPQ